MSVKKASKFRFYWIALMTGVITLYSCFKIITCSFLIKNFRQLVDQTMLSWAKRLLNLIRVTVVVTGNKNILDMTDRPIIVMCNHSSLYDIPISIVALKNSLRMLAKRELFRIPIFSTALRKGEFLSIHRQNREQSIKDLQRAKEKMLDGIILWVAPEGTRSKDGKLAHFKRGGFHLALDTKALIVPLVVKNVHKIQAGTDLTLFLNQQIEAEVCEPVDAADFCIEDRKQLIEKVRSRMLIALDQVEEVNV